MGRPDGSTLMYGTADKKTASALKEGLERNGWVFDKFETLRNGRMRYHATRTPEKAGLVEG